MVAGIKAIQAEVRDLRDIFETSTRGCRIASSTGRVTPELARKLGLTGLAGRASGQANDLRADFPAAPYGELGVRKAGYTAGDVAARVHLRFDEVLESLRLVRAIAMGAPDGEVARGAAAAAGCGVRRGLGMEGWRGEVLVTSGRARTAGSAAAMPTIPPWQDGPLIQDAVMGSIVPDFPLINKSFQPELLGTGRLMIHILKRIVRTGIVKKDAPSPSRRCAPAPRRSRRRC
ncbi:MAG: hypothetical protein IPH30_16895 [Betaproteobacteria bacterium]|nr:hypothetical protein [Betaproteobacteria bacterium]